MDFRLAGRDINYLSADDLRYELQIRGVKEATTVDRMRSWLRSLLKVELQTGLVIGSLGDHGSEIAVIRNKIDALTAELEAFRGTPAEANKIRAQLVHTFGRVNRLPMGETPEEKEARATLFTTVLTIKSSFDEKLRKTVDEQAVPPSTNSLVNFHLALASTPRRSPQKDDAESDDDTDLLISRLNPRNSQAANTAQQTVSIRPKDLRSWNLQFDGENMSVNAFIERAEELCVAYGVECDSLVASAIFLFAGKALVWWRANRSSLTSWSTMCSKLRAEFQPPDFDELLWDEIRTRRQGSTETVGIFIAHMENLFSRLNRAIPENVKVNVVRRNLEPFFQLQLGLTTTETMAELGELCKRLERCKYSADGYGKSSQSTSKCVEPDLACSLPNRKTRSHPKVSVVETTALPRRQPQATALSCWKCDKVGHRAAECRTVQGITCYKCKRAGYTVRTCPSCNSVATRNTTRSGN
ncbi:hypothetical protein Zmor_005733 [Zophobas morio]|uniref:CCHC-type domain-containing protein n=1 Tax=Zophobas morio TaxID=2755281 RepID=A0AA38IY59_9CUCU|nr:hypothetical protein Zmor_005733 [Zophobas morio]